MGSRRAVRGKELTWLGRLQTVVLILLIFTLGVEIGADEQVVASLGSIGLSALVITLFVLAGSVLAGLLGRKGRGLDRQGRSAAVALVALDKGPQLCDTYGQPVMDQLHCFVGNQWKKHYDTPMHQVVCRLTGSIFVVGSVDTTGPQLAARMQELYEQMPHECITTTGMMHRVQFTMSGAAAGLDEVEAKNWPALYELCDARLRKVQASGGDRIGCAE